MVTRDRSHRDKSGSPTWRSIAPSATICLGSLLCALALVALQIRYSDKVAELGLAAGLYFLEVVLFGVAVASILFGALSSLGHFEASHSGFKVKFSGAAAVFGFVVWLGIHFAPQVLPFTFTIYIHGAGGRQDLILRGTGEVIIDTGSLRRKRPVGADGDAVFLEIPANFLDKEVPVALDADGFELADPHPTVRLSKDGAYVEVRRKPGLIKGNCHDTEGRPLPGVTLTLAGMTKSSDVAGEFEFVVPGDKMQTELTLRATLPGFKTWSILAVPDSGDIPVTLVRQGGPA
jgi:hypothetical protein